MHRHDTETVRTINRQNALLWLRRVAERPEAFPRSGLTPSGVAASACDLRLSIELGKRPGERSVDWLNGVLAGGNLDDVAFAKAVAATLRV
ncbi:MAG: hypothetical protein AMXMBFR56_65990 [Polyangiaceae bacterium]